MLPLSSLRQMRHYVNISHTTKYEINSQLKVYTHFRLTFGFFAAWSGSADMMLQSQYVFRKYWNDVKERNHSKEPFSTSFRGRVV